MEPNLKDFEAKLDQIIALLRILASKEIEERRRVILSTSMKQQIYELSDGTNDMRTIATKSNASSEYVRLTIRDLEEIGFVTVKIDGTKRYPKKMI